METTVVNVKVKYIRPKYNNLKEWCDDPNNVYIARKEIVFIDGKRYPANNSIFANPYKLKDIPRDQAIELYKNHLQSLIDKNIITKQDLINLKGKQLGCWCKEGNGKEVHCHGDIIIDMIHKYT